MIRNPLISTQNESFYRHEIPCKKTSFRPSSAKSGKCIVMDLDADFMCVLLSINARESGPKNYLQEDIFLLLLPALCAVENPEKEPLLALITPKIKHMASLQTKIISVYNRVAKTIIFLKFFSPLCKIAALAQKSKTELKD